MKKLVFLFLFIATSSGIFAQTATEGIKVEAAVLKEYVGTFKFSETFQQCVFEYKDGDLYVEIDQYGQFKVFFLETDKVKSTSSYGSVFTFKRNAEKKITGLTIALMGQELDAVKE